MLRWRKKIRYLTYINIDVFIILLTLLIILYLFPSRISFLNQMNALEIIGFWGLTSFIHIILSTASGLYETIIENEGRYNKEIILQMIIISTLSVFFIRGSVNLLGASISYYNILYFISLLFFLQFNGKIFVKYIEFGKSDAIQTRNILVVGASEAGRRYVSEIKRYSYLNLQVAGYIKILDTDNYEGLEALGSLDQLEEIITLRVIDELAVVRPLSFDSRLKEKINYCQCMGITITMILELQNTAATKADVAMVGQIPVLKFHMVSLNESQLFIKRLLDVMGALAGMVLFGVAFIVFAPLIKLESPGPVIFKQQRVGKNGRIFTMFKFRSMVQDAELKKNDLLDRNEMKGHIFKLKDDPRLTRIGAFLRKSSIDEIPQFLNVLRGDMSLVGTRPPTVEEYTAYEARQKCRLSITPGLTGIWQISGRSDIKDFEDIILLDVEYISNWTLLLDLEILLKTFGVVLSGKGSS